MTNNELKSQLENKLILDACCGSRMFWFNKQDKRVLFTDIRREEHILCDGRKLEITPDVIMDFRNMDFPDNYFKVVVFDPPHLLKLGKTSWMAKKYGTLSENWREDLKKGFDECMRVLEKYGILIFKWNERDIKISEIISIFGVSPLFGHTTTINTLTKWMMFIKDE